MNTTVSFTVIPFPERATRKRMVFTPINSLDFAILNNTPHRTVFRAVMLASVIYSALIHMRKLKFSIFLRMMLMRCSIC